MTEELKLPPVEIVPENPAWVKNERASQEEKNWGDEEELRGVKRKNDILWHKVYGVVVVALMIILVLIFMASLGVWVFHYITPWQFLTADQLSKIQSVIFSGSLGAIVSAYMQRQLSK